MQLTSFANWCEWQEKYEYLPYVERVSLDCYTMLDERGAPFSWEPLWQTATNKCAFVLESGKNGRYTYFGLQPADVISGKGGQPLTILKQWMSDKRAPNLADAPDFMGGCVGYLSYDVARSIERLPTLAQDDLQVPDYFFARYEQLWIIDHLERQLYFTTFCDVSNGFDESLAEDRLHQRLQECFLGCQQRIADMKRQWEEWLVAGFAAGQARRHAFAQYDANRDIYPLRADDGQLHTSFSEQQFIEAVKKIQDYIAAGDVFQVNLSVRQSRPLHTDATDIYEWLRLLNPSPYMGFLKFPTFDLVCGSPELLIKLDGERLTTRPIAGTRPRGNDDVSDGELAAELILNEKERAEHIMLVDLQRNDIGRVSQLGSVRVSDLMTIEKYSHVMHIVSQVEGRMRAGLDAFDAIAATFPGGTITGAPKIRTMEIIEELEPVRRGPYTGSLGWIDFNGDMELNIIIRTMLAHQGWAHVQAGAGIVIDSVPEKEFVESLNKARAMWTAMRLSEQMPMGVIER